MNAEESYIYGLLLADGNIYFSRSKDRAIDNRGRVSLEVNSKDKDIIVKLFNLIPNSHIRERTRDTNFKKDYTTCLFVNSQKGFRDWLIDCGFPKEDKTFKAAPPKIDYSKEDFWRGFIDGDGSLGFTKTEKPFVSIVTTSDLIKDSFCDYIYERYGILKHLNKNKRDSAYNIVLQQEDAVNLVRDLWQKDCLCLDRKAAKANQIRQWVRPEGTQKRCCRQIWTKEQDEYILTHSLEDSIHMLHRTKGSIQTRLSKLSKQA